MRKLKSGWERLFANPRPARAEATRSAPVNTRTFTLSGFPPADEKVDAPIARSRSEAEDRWEFRPFRCRRQLPSPASAAILLLLCVLSAAVQAQDFTYITDAGTITLTGYTGAGGAVNIPDTIEGLPVTVIGTQVFYGKTSLTSVVIPDTVTTIGNLAFFGCINMTGVTIGNSVTTIEDFAFYNCTSLASVTIPDSVTSLGYGVFYDCTSLTSVTIPDSVATIGGSAFSGCTKLASVTIGNGVTSIGDSAFFGCTNLTDIAVDATNPKYSGVDGVLFNKTQTTLIQYPGGKAGDYAIPDSVTTIGSLAFYGCINLTSVTIPDSVTSIGGSAFYGCTNLASVTIGRSVTSIGGGVFFGCASLTDIEVDTANPAYGSADGVLFDKTRTTLILCPAGKAGGYTIPSSVTAIGDNAFRNCAALASVTIPESVTTIGDYAFADCTSLTSVYFKGNAPSLGGPSVSLRADNALVYYLPGTTGWEATFAGRPTVLWNPTPQITAPTDPFGFIISGTEGLVIVVEAATNLSTPDWTPVSTNTLTDGTSSFSDPQWSNHPARFYRLRSP